MVQFNRSEESANFKMWYPTTTTYRPLGSTFLGPVHHKRKTDPDVEILPPPKIHITEEKMVSQLKGIHLSEDYRPHGAPQPTTQEVELDECIRSKLDSEGCLPSLVVCDEIRALQGSLEPALPAALLEKYQKPSTALVLWQPPSRDAQRAISAAVNTTFQQPQQNTDVEMNEDDDDNNNGSANNHMNGPSI